VAWDVEYTDEFDAWWESLSEDDQEAIWDAVAILQRDGPACGRPLVDTITSSRHPNMKELRVGTIRILFAFNPLRVAILLIGGNKRGRWQAWYDEMIPVADALYDVHLAELQKEGLL
jgi:hypothetical protein